MEFGKLVSRFRHLVFNNGNDSLDIELVSLTIQLCQIMSWGLNLIGKKRNGEWKETLDKRSKNQN